MVKTSTDLPSKVAPKDDTVPLLNASQLPPTITASATATTPLATPSRDMARTTTNNSESIQPSDGPDRASAAGIGTGVVSLFLCGPFFAVLLGFGAYYAAKENKDGLGDVARSMGDLSLSVKDKAVEIDRKHRLVDRVKTMFAGPQPPR